MSTKIAAKGTQVKYGASATPSTVVGGVKSAKLKVGSRKMLDATAHDSSTTQDYIPAPLRDTNEVVVNLLYDPADTSHELIRSHHAAGTKGYLTLVLPDTGAAEWAHSGYWTDWETIDLDPETGLLEVQATFKALGAETFTQ